jgi:hypothetical protein
MENKNITAVEWLEREIIKRFKRSVSHYTDSEWSFDMITKLSKQAKEMEKQQIINAYYYGNQDLNYKKGSADQYYKETFNKQKNE